MIWMAPAGDREAFSVLVDQNQCYVFNLARRVVGDEQEVEDLAQEAFACAWLALPNFRIQARFRTWLFRIVTNLWYNRLPGLRCGLSDLGEDCLTEVPDDSPSGIDPVSSIEAEERWTYLHRRIDELPESNCLLIVLRYQQGLAYDEIVV